MAGTKRARQPAEELTEPEAYRRDVPTAEVHVLDAGHFALETHAQEIGEEIRDFLGTAVNTGAALKTVRR